MIAGRPSSRAIPSLGELLRVAGLGVGLVLLPTCARPGQPPGGPRDILPPQVIATMPEPGGQMEEADGEVVLRFNETLSERPVNGRFEAGILVSPQLPGIQVSHAGDRIVIRAPGGWPALQVFRVRVLPIYQDLFNNRMAGPFEFAFGRGIAIPEGTIAGIVYDRITGEPAVGIRVEARTTLPLVAGDTLTYVSRTDSAGVFGHRLMREGPYVVRAFDDLNNNGVADPFERFATDSATIRIRRDTAVVQMSVLAPDTTPALVVGMEVVADSAAVRVTLDDYIDPLVPFDEVVVRIRSDSAPTPGVWRVLHDFEYRRLVQERDAAARAAADTTGETSAELPPDSTTPRPIREFVVTTLDSLLFGVSYVVEVSGITNINGLPGGAGTDTIVRPAPPPEEDEAQAPSDSLAAPPDTGGVARR